MKHQRVLFVKKNVIFFEALLKLIVRALFTLHYIHLSISVKLHRIYTETDSDVPTFPDEFQVAKYSIFQKVKLL